MNVRFWLLVVVFVVFVGTGGHEAASQRVSKNKSIKDTRIVGGKPTSISTVKYLVHLLHDGAFVCGGSLITRRHVVTAAHCVKGVNPRRIHIIGGSSFLYRGGHKRRVSKIMIPRQFNIQTMNMDVAVIKLSSPMRGRNTATIPLCAHKLIAGMAVRVSGWGLTAETGSNPSKQLRTTIVRMRTQRSCQRNYQGIMLTRSMICASVPGLRDSCSGDSGGPLVHNQQLCGIVSWGAGCGRFDSPGVYTAINRVKEFIKRSLRR